MGFVAAPDYMSWQTRYPEFSAVSSPTYGLLFAEAGVLHANDGSGPVTTAVAQQTLMQMLTAHLAALYVQSQGDVAPGDAKNANTPVGRLSDATQGSVSGSFDWPSAADSSAMEKWLTQTKYGAEYWAATLLYRQLRYARGFYAVPGGCGGASFRW